MLCMSVWGVVYGCMGCCVISVWGVVLLVCGVLCH